MTRQAERLGPSEQGLTSVEFCCGAEASEFLGAHHPECPYWHACQCTPKHSSLPDCHRCQCTACWFERAAWDERIRARARP